MSQRITIILDDEIVKKVRKKQAKALLKLEKSVSFSKIVSQCLKECLKREKKILD